MTFSWPASRNSFHLAWLSLPLPPLVALIVESFSPTTSLHPALVLRLLLAGLVLLPVVWWRAGPAKESVRRLLKELRSQLPGFLVAVLVPGLLALADAQALREWMIFVYGFGCLLMGAASFGSEFEQCTLAGLLAQPKSRAALFGEKQGILAILLLIATVNLLLLFSPVAGAGLNLHDGFEVVMVALFALATGPLYSLLSRSTLAGLVFSVSVPPILYLVGWFLLQLFYWISNPGNPLPDEWADGLLTAGIPVYLLGTCFLGWRQFRGLQLREGGGAGQIGSQLHPLSRPLDILLSRWLSAPGATAQLVRKELRLQVVPWLVAGIMVGLWVLWLAVRFVTPVTEDPGTLQQFSGVALMAGLLGVMALLGTGAACIAEERELGTLEWQLTQPASLARQWWVKLGVTTFLSVGLGVVLPGLLLLLGFGWDRLSAEFGERPPWEILPFGAVILLLLTVSIYASSISRNTMKAAAAAVGIGAGLAGLLGLSGFFNIQRLDVRIASSSYNLDFNVLIPAPNWAPSELFVMVTTGLLIGALILFILTILLAMAAGNSRRLVVSTRRIFRQLVCLGLGIFLFSTAVGMGLMELSLRQQQARVVQWQEDTRAQLAAELSLHSRSGRLTPGLYEQFGLATNASPQVLAEAIFAARGPRALSEVTHLFRSTGGIDPSLAIRYRLLDPETVTNSRRPPRAQPQLRLDPELQRRYGLEPTAPR